MNGPEPQNNPPPVTNAGEFNYSELLFRLVVLGLLLASVGLLWWSYNREFAPRLQESRDYNATVIRLTAEVDDLDRRWSKPDIEQINRKFELAQTRIFAGQPALEAWLADLREQLTPLGINANTKLEKVVVPAGIERPPSVIPGMISIEIQPVTGEMSSPYQRLLQLVQRLITQEKRADLTELTVDSGTNSIGGAALNFNFWTDGKESK